MILLTGTGLQAQDGQWRGPQRDGKYPDTGLLKSWPEGGPELLLRKDGLGNGYSSPLVVDEKIYIMGGLGTVVCMDTGSGEILWQRNTHQEFEGEFHRWGMTESLLLTDNAVISTPIDHNGSKLILITSSENLMGVDPECGEVYWKVDLLKYLGERGHRINTNTPWKAGRDPTGPI